MNLAELADRVLGFMPQRTILWSGVGTFLLSITIQYFNHWAKELTKLPWMKGENQRNRQEILQGTANLSEEKGGVK